MLYDYECSKCGHIQEEFHGMKERPFVHCDICRGACIKLISVNPENIFAASVPLYDFVDEKTTPGKVRIQSKRQWHDHLKRVRQREASNTPPTASELAAEERTKKMYAKRELKEAIVASVKDKKHIHETKKKVIESVAKSRKPIALSS